MKAWWFSEGYTLPHGDGREVTLGTTHKVSGDIIPCGNGLHASKRAIDALGRAPGTIVWRVEQGGTIVEHDDKAAASERTYIAGGIDVSDTLRKFARMCAQDVLHLWHAPEVVKRYLKTGDEGLRHDALDAVRGVAGDAARAARGAAWAVRAAAHSAWAAEMAARAAAGAARTARDAAWGAACAAWAAEGDEDAAWDAAREKQNARLHRMLLEAIRREGTRG